MTEQEWADEPSIPQKKKGLPGWLWFCGGGCLIAVVLAVIVGFLVFSEVKKGMDPEIQKARLEETIAMDEWPAQMRMMFGWDKGMDFWVINDDRGYMTIIYDFPDSASGDREEMFSDSFQGGGIAGFSKIENPELGEVEVQGRMLPIQRFYHEGGGGPAAPGQPDLSKGPAAFIDITPEGDPGFMMIFLIRVGSGEPIPDEFIQEMLKPFHIGPIR